MKAGCQQEFSRLTQPGMNKNLRSSTDCSAHLDSCTSLRMHTSITYMQCARLPASVYDFQPGLAYFYLFFANHFCIPKYTVEISWVVKFHCDLNVYDIQQNRMNPLFLKTQLCWTNIKVHAQ